MLSVCWLWSLVFLVHVIRKQMWHIHFVESLGSPVWVGVLSFCTVLHGSGVRVEKGWEGQVEAGLVFTWQGWDFGRPGGKQRGGLSSPGGWGVRRFTSKEKGLNPELPWDFTLWCLRCLRASPGRELYPSHSNCSCHITEKQMFKISHHWCNERDFRLLSCCLLHLKVEWL